jgi:hypothetical protein
MSDSDKRKYNPSVTIQIDQRDLLIDGSVEKEGERPSAPPRRTAPPPLPPELASGFPPSGPPLPGQTHAPPARRSMGRTLGYVAAFVMLFAAAIGAGMFVGGRARRRLTPAPAPSSAGAPSIATAAAPLPSASASAHTLTMPAVEIR